MTSVLSMMQSWEAGEKAYTQDEQDWRKGMQEVLNNFTPGCLL